jgi:hypothetical protein
MRVLILSFLIFSNSFATENCNLNSLTKNCSLLRDLKPDENLVFPDGQSIPSCALSSTNSKSQDELNTKEKEIQSNILRILQQTSSNKFDEQVLESLFNSNQMETMFEHESGTLRWPPHSNDKSYQEITKYDIDNYWVQTLGKARYQKLKQQYAIMRKLSNSRMDSRLNREPFKLNNQRPRVEKLFSSSKNAVEKFLLNGRSESNLSAAEADILDRIRQVRIDPNYGDDIDCGPPYLAAYNYNNKKVLLPPSLLFYPDQSIIRVLIHEISHSIDLCRLSTVPNPRNGLDYFANEGIEKSPLWSVHKCLTSTSGGDFMRPIDPSLEDLHKENVCDNNKHNEAFCDWLAANILANQPELLEQKNFEKPSAMNKMVQKPVRAPAGLDVLLLQADSACSEIEKKETVWDEHPSWERRVNDIMLREPKLRARANCRSQGESPCRNKEMTIPDGSSTDMVK